MDILALKPSPALSVISCDDPDELRDRLPPLRRSFLPLGRNFDFWQADILLGSTRLGVLRRPPCISSGHLVKGQTAIALTMTDPKGLKLDGLPIEEPVLAVHSSERDHRVFQPTEFIAAGVFIPDAEADRGWPSSHRQTRAEPVQAECLENIRSIIWDILFVASRAPDRFAKDTVLAGMQQSLIASIDHAFATTPGKKIDQCAIGRYVRICRRADEYIRSGSKKLPSSNEIAEAAGVTVRTLHNAMVAVNGMSLQRFMILQRLWGARAALLRAAPGDLVKTVALDHGFWHLGRFSRTYAALFGETPSQTISRARSAINNLS